jgi:hypothetical protein
MVCAALKFPFDEASSIRADGPVITNIPATVPAAIFLVFISNNIFLLHLLFSWVRFTNYFPS